MSNEERWHEWRGGACPVDPDTIVEVRVRYGQLRIATGRLLHWSHDLYNAHGAEDIMAYRVAESPGR